MGNKRLLVWISITILATLCVGGYGVLIDMPPAEVLQMVIWVNGISATLALLLWLAQRHTAVEDVKYNILDADSDWESGFSTRSGRPLQDTERSRELDRQRQEFLREMQEREESPKSKVEG